jgi:hypothetical protein
MYSDTRREPTAREAVPEQLFAIGRSLAPFVLAATCGAVALAPFLARWSLLHTRTFDPDEFQHLHATWAVHQGQVPFRDFFEHHMPGMQLLLAPLMNRFDIAGNADDAVAFVFAARIVMMVCAGLALLLAARLAHQHGGMPIAAIGSALLGASIVFLGRTLEVRPDTPALVLWIASLSLLSGGISRAHHHALRWFGLGGLCFGGALVLNQKLLMAGPGLAAFGGLYLLPRAGAAPEARVTERVGHLAVFAVTAALPSAALAAWFWSEGALGALVQGALLDNLRWPREMAPTATLRWMAERDPVLSALAVGGFVREGLALGRARWPASPVALLWLAGASLLALLFVTPTPFPQYLLLVFPIGALFGARLVWAVVTDLPARRLLDAGGTRVESAVIGVVLVGAAATVFAVARPVYVHPAVYPVVAVVSLTAAAMLAVRRLPHLAALAVMAACSIYSFQQIRWMAGLSNDAQITAMREIHRATGAEDTVLDGFTGTGWFRPQASYFGFLHPGVRAFLTPAQAGSVAGALEGCDDSPDVVILDDHLRALSSDVEPLVRARYRAATLPGVWLRDVAGHCGGRP